MPIPNEEVDQWLFNLLLRREALADFEEPIQALVNLCRSREEYDLLTHSLEHLIALSSAQFVKQIHLLSNFIRDELLDESPTAIVAMAWGEQPDSSQILVQQLKPIFRKYKNIKFFNSVNLYEKKGNVAKFPKFILVDDFAGTGKTVKSRMNHILKHAKSEKVVTDPFACLLFGMEKAKQHLEDEGIPAHFCTSLKAGISGYFSGGERDDRIALMKRIEEELAAEIDGTALPSLGHGEAEALFFIKDANAPNSNFPIFWWPIDCSGNDRNTLMNRAEL